ncbi:hypothetical protein GCM10022222_63510 [Amycolatopsis ultiminotia]|uniref:Uncharacterized protein n=1 Tax=Amycolatopsis ultiminotia TaxID=543629 RepID=A0ABP6XPT5_9PSEU
MAAPVFGHWFGPGVGSTVQRRSYSAQLRELAQEFQTDGGFAAGAGENEGAVEVPDVGDDAGRVEAVTAGFREHEPFVVEAGGGAQRAAGEGDGLVQACGGLLGQDCLVQGVCGGAVLVGGELGQDFPGSGA